MKAKSYLERLRKTEVLIEHKKEHVDLLRELAIGKRAPELDLSGVRTKSSDKHGSYMENKIMCYMDAEADLHELITSYIEERRKILSDIEQLETSEYIILYEMYVHGKTYMDLAEQLDKSYSYVAKKHYSALRNLDRIIDRN